MRLKTVLIVSFFLGAIYTSIAQKERNKSFKGSPENSYNALLSKENLQLSPYTGYTRDHWLEITQKIIAGVMIYIDVSTG